MAYFKRYSILCALLVFLAGPSLAAAVKPDYIIRENFFVNMMMDIYMNYSSYEGKLVQYEGFVMEITEELFDAGPEKFAVVRIAICCGPDDMPMGFACMWDGETPPENTWVKVTGILRSRDYEDDNYPYLEVKELTVLKKRGKDKVGSF